MSRPDLQDERLATSLATLRAACPGCFSPRVGIILGSGLGELADEIESAIRIPFERLPGVEKSTATGHRGQWTLGRLNGTSIVAMAGRLHRYEGYRDEQIVFPIRLMAGLGVRVLILSNAAGGLNPLLRVGDLVVIRDHIDLGRRRQDEPIPWRDGVESPESVPRPKENAWAPLMQEPYDRELAELALAAARSGNFRAFPGIYLATRGPTYETRAEYRMMRRLGADVVGMSTAPEARWAATWGVRVLGLSVVTNVASPERGLDQAPPTEHSAVLEVGKAATARLRAIVHHVLRRDFV